MRLQKSDLIFLSVMFVVAVLLGGFLIQARIDGTVKSTLSIQNNIQDRNSHYSWEQWCRYEFNDGSHKDVHVADFSIESDAIHGQLTTNVCDTIPYER